MGVSKMGNGLNGETRIVVTDGDFSLLFLFYLFCFCLNCATFPCYSIIIKAK